jgi:hypothetical protein
MRLSKNDDVVTDNCWVVQTCFSSFEMSRCLRLRLTRFRSLMTMILHESVIYFAQDSMRSWSRVWVCNWLRCMFIEVIYVSTSRIDTRMIRKTLAIVLKYLFCNIVNRVIVGLNKTRIGCPTLGFGRVGQRFLSNGLARTKRFVRRVDSDKAFCSTGWLGQSFLSDVQTRISAVRA